MMRTRWNQLLTLSALLALAACGGGGGGGNNNTDHSPNAFSFDPSQIADASAGASYTATAVVAGFDGTLPAQITASEGDAAFALLSEGEGVEEISVSAGNTLTLQVIVDADAQAGTTASATVTVGEGDDAKSASLTLSIVDKSAPELSLSFPPAFSITPAETVTLTGHWSEIGGETVSLQLTRNGQETEMPSHMLFADGTWQIDLPLEDGENVIGLAATDASGNQGEPISLTVVRTDDADTAVVDQGLAFSNPKELVLDPANKRLLAISAKRVQGVSLADGHRGEHDLLQVPILRIGGAALHEDDLWMSLYVDPGLGALPVIARTPVSTFGSGDAPPNQLSGDFFHQPLLGRSSGLLVDENFVYVGTRTEVEDAIYRIDRSTNAAERIFADDLAGGNRKHMLRIDADTFIHADVSDIELVDLGDPENPVVKNILRPDVTADVGAVKGYAYDGIRKRLYMVGTINNPTGTQFGWVDLADLANPESAPVVDVVHVTDIFGGMPGYPARVNQLYGFALDAENERLFALSGLQGPDEGREVVAINLMAVAVDEDGVDGYDTDSDGNIVRRQTGETVLLSRSGARPLP